MSPNKNGMFNTSTKNSAGHFIIMACDTKQNSDSCYFIANFGLTCKKGDVYPGLINSKIGATSVTLTCHEDNGVFITPAEDVFKAVKSEGTIGIAIPHTDGSFTVSRFSLKGFATAFKGMESVIVQTRAAYKPAFERL